MDTAPLLGFDPEDPDAWTVLADWLTARGDPRGLMLALEAAESETGDQAPVATKSGQLEDLRRRHLHRYREALWPVFRVSSEVAARRHVELRWRAGLVIAARLLGPDRRATVDLGAKIDGLLASEAALAIAELRCDCVDPNPVVDALVAGPPRPTIRTLSLGDYRTPMPALDRLWANLPGLRELELFGPGVEPDGLAKIASQLTRLRLCSELDPTALGLFEGPPLPRLRALALRLGGDDYFSSAHAEPGPAGDHRLRGAGLGRTGDRLARLLDGGITPGLEHLAITGVAFADALIVALADSPLLPRLRTLDLSDSRFAPHRHSLQELDTGTLRLTVRGSDLGPKQLGLARRQFGDRLRTG